METPKSLTQDTAVQPPWQPWLVTAAGLCAKVICWGQGCQKQQSQLRELEPPDQSTAIK